MNENDLYIEYLLEMGAMTPEQEKLARQQAYVDSLRTDGTAAPQGRMVGNTYVAPSWSQYAGQLGNAWMARSGQKKLDEDYKAQNTTEQDAISRLRASIARKRGVTLPSQAPVGAYVTKRPYGMEDEQPY
jgi:hypothetical protein